MQAKRERGKGDGPSNRDGEIEARPTTFEVGDEVRWIAEFGEEILTITAVKPVPKSQQSLVGHHQTVRFRDASGYEDLARRVSGFHFKLVL